MQREQIVAQEKRFLALDAELNRVLSQQNREIHEKLFSKSQELAEANSDIKKLRQQL